MNARVEITPAILSSEEILQHWQGHRGLTRRVIDAFPEKELFEFSIGGMRPFSEITKELLAIAVPGLTQIVHNKEMVLEEKREELKTKQDLLNAWDQSTDEINALWKLMKAESFRDEINLFGQYNNIGIKSIQYFIDNEIHHRGQGYVYLRALGIEPPFFWEH